MDFVSLLNEGAGRAWLYLPVAVLLGGLHGLEPGHSKTMMAAFIIAVRGTVTQAALLGLSAAISHSLVIWALAAMALKFGDHWNVEATEPYFLVGTGLIVIAMAVWTWWRLRGGHRHHHHHHDHDNDEVKRIEAPGGSLELSIFEDGVPPRFRMKSSGAAEAPKSLRTVREDGATQAFTFVSLGDGGWESREEIPEPHAFRVELVVAGEARTVEFAEAHDHAHGHDHPHGHDHDDEDDDEHARQHAEEIRRRFDGREVTTPQIVLFGLTGGLMPCPAALSILLICLQLKEFTLGFSIVAGFSLGLALTLVSVGVAAAWGMRKMTAKGGRFSRWAKRAPYFSNGLLLVLGAVFVARGLWLLG